MDIQNLVREKVIGNIKTGMKGENGLPKKLPYFHVEEDKATSTEMVNIFKQLYPEKPTSLKIMFTSENPFNFKYKRYVNNKVVCIGNDTKAITVGKDNRGNNAQIEIECNEQCEQRLSGRCKLVGSLKFVLVGINAGGVWKINTTGGFSLSNIASEIVKYKKANMSIVGVPFELTLTPQESLAYGTYYSIDLHRTDIKPELTVSNQEKVLEESKTQDVKQLPSEAKSIKKSTKKEKVEVEVEKNEESNKIEEKKEETKEQQKQEEPKEDFSNYLTIKGFMPTMISNKKFDKIIFQDINSQDVEYVLHPKADQKIMECGQGSIIEMLSSKMEAGRNILCKYKIRQNMSNEGQIIEQDFEELKEAV